jgi:hypothetical protein
MNIRAIAESYLTARHTPVHPSYAAFARDTVAQYRGLVAQGYQFQFVSEEPYKHSACMFSDVARKHLLVLRTSPNALAPDNPLLAYLSPGICVNDVFRAVHDILGHYATNAPFETLTGELEAYQNHKRLYSAESIPALYSETIGQLAHYYAGYGFVRNQENKIIGSAPNRTLAASVSRRGLGDVAPVTR